MDKSLTHRRNFKSLRKKLTSCVALLRRLVGCGWGVRASTLRTATFALVHSTAEHCVPAWYCRPHTRLTDPSINDTLRIVTGYLHPKPADNLPIFAGIQPAELRRNGATLSLACRAIGAWTFAPLSAHLSIESKCTAPQIETPICTRRTTTYQFF